MSITTSQRLNGDDIQARLPAGTAFSAAGGRLADPTPKTFTAIGTDDTALQTAITGAAGVFVDHAANQTTLESKAALALSTNSTYLAVASPTNAQVVAQVKALTMECNALIRLLLGQFDSTGGT